MAVKAARAAGLHEGIRQVRAAVPPLERDLRRRRMAFYTSWISPGDLCFDVGANVGNRVDIFVRLGARVVAVEPQPECLAELRRRFGQSGQVTILPFGLAASKGSMLLHVSSTYHPVSTMSERFMDETKASGRFGDTTWTTTQEVEVATLDSVIREYGMPRFCKIDVEGFEYEVLRGLSQPLPALSFEFTPEVLEQTSRCLERLAALGEYEYNFSLGESMRWESEWSGGPALLAALSRFAPGSDWGDVYARLVS
ncbi:MAG TPA: FkbM family methyltransferase [Egibacteraceae bacterium]|jgi:FkbM family methyltransferase|nr:FkbM family methyltransferase [Egibacteraceae bacterium]